MDGEKISVTSVEYLDSNENQNENNRNKEENQVDKETSAWNMCHVFSVLTVCVVFSIPVTLIPRKNSIFYQSSWYEFNFVMAGIVLLDAANDILNIATYFKNKSIRSLRMLLKTYTLYMVTMTIPTFIAYIIWCQYLKYNWPMPFLGYNYLLFKVVHPAVIWISFPRHLRTDKDFQKNFQILLLYVLSALFVAFLREGISVLFKALPGYLQWVVAFLVPLMKELETFVQSRFVNRMTGGLEEASKVCLGFAINSAYSFFIAARLPNAEIITVCSIIAIDFFLQLKMTHKIVQLHNEVNTETTENGIMEKQRMVTKLVLAELTEGMTPIVYAIVFSLAYFGYNGTLLRNVKNDYWGAKPVNDLGYLFQMMLLLFGVDAFSVMVNSFILSTLTNVNLFRECCRIMKHYWIFMAVKFAVKMVTMIATKDINSGMDTTGEWNWITNDGRISMINSSTYLSNEEKSLLLDTTTFKRE